ncbi:uncharacterized protein B0H18DRAFT_1113614 [Fomitopsis serialis]|uniref:uncharacterized protein n=1 Tax=Fomitopsis serialis TaxID=139415 RepID=UPI002008CEDB|nr:uncharacterized protein B0H18DRAFT_1113614 [Neoantrodia serialis]KAH9936181.1 hypothetical protein B0H18DRAFT_1113614 [Neoantrodia serialis]
MSMNSFPVAYIKDGGESANPPEYYITTVPQVPVAGPAAVNVQPMPVLQLTNAQVGYNYQLEMMAKCARGEHQLTKKYGPAGIICSVFLFPVGLLFLLCDNKKKCERCGAVY